MVTLCTEVAKGGDIPAAQSVRCGDAFLAEGQAALAAKRPADALPLLERAVKLVSKKDAAQTALNDAKAQTALVTATASLTESEKKFAAGDFKGASESAKTAQRNVTEVSTSRPDDAAVRELPIPSASSTASHYRRNCPQRRGSTNPHNRRRA